MKFTKLQMLFIRNVWSEERLIKIYKKHYYKGNATPISLRFRLASILLDEVVIPLNLLNRKELNALLFDYLNPDSFYNIFSFYEEDYCYTSKLFTFITGLIITTEKAKFGEDMVWPLRVRKM